MEEVPPVEDMNEDGPYKCPVLKVFRDIKGRRAALVKALTTDFDVLYKQCDPEKESLCLYGYPDGEWRVDLPVEQVPSDVPEPALGINIRRDVMDKDEWRFLVAAHSNAWPLSLAFYFGAMAGFDKADRNRIFNLINNLPTLSEVVIGKSVVSVVSNQEEAEEFDGSGDPAKYYHCASCSSNKAARPVTSNAHSFSRSKNFI